MEIRNILGYLLNTSARFIKRRMDKELERYDMTTSQWAILKSLDTKSELTQAQIAEELLADRATIGTIIFKLIEKKYVEKKIDPADRRAYVVCLTPKAREVIKIIEKKAEEVSKQALEGLGEDQVKIFYYSLNKIIHNLSGEE